VFSCCGKDFKIISEDGGLAIYFCGEANSFVCFAGKVEKSGAEKCFNIVLSLGITGSMRSTPTSADVILYLFIKQEAKQVANRLLGNGCSYVPNFGHSEVLIRLTEKTPLYFWFQGTIL
jgi:hypothetical protein